MLINVHSIHSMHSMHSIKLIEGRATKSEKGFVLEFTKQAALSACNGFPRLSHHLPANTSFGTTRNKSDKLLVTPLMPLRRSNWLYFILYGRSCSMYLMASLQMVSATMRASLLALASAKAWSRISVAVCPKRKDDEKCQNEFKNVNTSHKRKKITGLYLFFVRLWNWRFLRGPFLNIRSFPSPFAVLAAAILANEFANLIRGNPT